jgi:hypothetical protein
MQNTGSLLQSPHSGALPGCATSRCHSTLPHPVTRPPRAVDGRRPQAGASLRSTVPSLLQRTACDLRRATSHGVQPAAKYPDRPFAATAPLGVVCRKRRRRSHTRTLRARVLCIGSLDGIFAARSENDALEWGRLYDAASQRMALGTGPGGGVRQPDGAAGAPG